MLACPRRQGGHLRVRSYMRHIARISRRQSAPNRYPTHNPRIRGFVVNFLDFRCNFYAADASWRRIVALPSVNQRCSLPCHRNLLAEQRPRSS